MDPKSNTIGIFTERVAVVACPHCDAELDVSEFPIFDEIQCPNCEGRVSVPGRLGNFLLLSELGRGAMGCVYLAIDEALGRHVALKVMRKEYGEDPEMLETLQREAQAMAALNHRNVVQVYSFGKSDDQPYVVMELLDGERLDEMMEGGKKVDEVRALEIACDVAEGLKAAHFAGMTHGDIKPANILMDRDGEAKVVDFGLARFIDPDAEIEVWGTPYYIAPEKARKKGEDFRSDQYSLGATIFHSLAGKPPFNGDDPTKVVVASLKEETPDLAEWAPELSAPTAAVIRRMMDKTPHRRYPTYASLQADLKAALEFAQAAAEEREQKEAEDHKVKKKNTMIPVMIASAVVVVGAIAAVVNMQKKGDDFVDQYPDRELHEPFTRVEVRNITEAVTLLKNGKLRSMQESLKAASSHVPEEHASHGWYRFFTGTMLMYAGVPDQARKQYEKIDGGGVMEFDAAKPPPEDPRLLAKIALGSMGHEDVKKMVKGAQPYFQELAEVAYGAQLIFNKESIKSAKHFKRYGEKGSKGVPKWAYAMTPLMNDMHLRATKSAPRKDTSTAKSADKPEVKNVVRTATPTAKPPVRKPSNPTAGEPQGAGVPDHAKVVYLDQRERDGDWQSIGTFQFKKGRGNHVRISNKGTKGHVVADGIRFVKAGLPTIVLDAENSRGVERVGEWLSGTFHEGFAGKNYLYDNAVGKGEKYVTFHPILPAEGEWDIQMRWPANSRRSASVPVSIWTD